MTTANITPTAGSDGITYGTSVPLTSTEATLGDGLITPDPIATEYGQAIVAVVKLTVTGLIISQNSYVVMQQDMGDGVWVDIAWCLFTGNQGTATFVLSGGGVGAMNNSFQQTRQSGQFPASAGSNAGPLGGRIRFVGKTTSTGGSSATVGTAANVAATIKYKLLSPR